MHHRHHANHASMEKDEVSVGRSADFIESLKPNLHRYVPKTRSDLGLPPGDDGKQVDYSEFFADTPVWTLLLLIRQQLLAFPTYLLFNVSGQKGYPKWTNHFNRKRISHSDFSLIPCKSEIERFSILSTFQTVTQNGYRDFRFRSLGSRFRLVPRIPIHRILSFIQVVHRSLGSALTLDYDDCFLTAYGSFFASLSR